MEVLAGDEFGPSTWIDDNRVIVDGLSNDLVLPGHLVLRVASKWIDLAGSCTDLTMPPSHGDIDVS